MITHLLTKRELAELLKVRPDRVWKMARAGKIPEIVLGPHIRRYDFEAVMEALKRPGTAKVSEGK